MANFHRDEAKKIKMADSKKGFGLVGLNDPKNTDVANNLCGRETVQHKLENGLKHKKCIFLPVIEFTSDSLTAIQVDAKKLVA